MSVKSHQTPSPLAKIPNQMNITQKHMIVGAFMRKTVRLSEYKIICDECFLVIKRDTKVMTKTQLALYAMRQGWTYGMSLIRCPECSKGATDATVPDAGVPRPPTDVLESPGAMVPGDVRVGRPTGTGGAVEAPGA